MTDRTYRLTLGVLLLSFLYFDFSQGIWTLIALLSFEGLTNFQVPAMANAVCSLSGCERRGSDLSPIHATSRYRFDSERGFRLLVAAVLAFSYLAFPDELWFLTWFLGFAILGAGISSVCPALTLMKWVGFA